jgi:hypothetical protein
MATTVIEIGYDEAAKSIALQANVLDNLRSRAGALLAAASLVTSFLGGQALARPSLVHGVVVRPDLGCWGVVAVVGFVGLALLCIAILWPYQWRFAMGANPIIDAAGGEHPMDVQTVYSHLAQAHDRNYDLNQRKIDSLFWVFRVACLLLTAQTVAWILDLRT